MAIITVDGRAFEDRRRDRLAEARARRARRARIVGALAAILGGLLGASLKPEREDVRAASVPARASAIDLDAQVDRVIQELWKMEADELR